MTAPAIHTPQVGALVALGNGAPGLQGRRVGLVVGRDRKGGVLVRGWMHRLSRWTRQCEHYDAAVLARLAPDEAWESTQAARAHLHEIVAELDLEIDT